MGKAENPVQRAVLDLLGYEKIWHRRFNSGALVVEATETAKRRFIAYGSKGMADIMATPYIYQSAVGAPVQLCLPCILWIECKSATGKQRAAQKEFEKEVIAAGHHYILARSSDDVIAWLKSQYYKKGKR